MTVARFPRTHVPVLVFVRTVVAVLSSLGAPLVPAVAGTTRTTLPSARWSPTATLLVGAVATPVVGTSGSSSRSWPSPAWASFAAFPALVIPAVPPSETGSAMSLDQVLRYVGFALGSALTATVLATVLAAATPSGAAAPAAGGYTVLAVVGVAVCATTATVAWRAVRRSSPDGPAAVPVRRSCLGPVAGIPGLHGSRRSPL